MLMDDGYLPCVSRTAHSRRPSLIATCQTARSRCLPTWCCCTTQPTPAALRGGARKSALSHARGRLGRGVPRLCESRRSGLCLHPLPDFLNAIELEEACWLVKRDGCTEVHRAKDNAQVAAYMGKEINWATSGKRAFRRCGPAMKEIVFLVEGEAERCLLDTLCHASCPLE